MENVKYTPAESNILGIDIILFEDNEANCGFRTAIPLWHRLQKKNGRDIRQISVQARRQINNIDLAHCS